MELLHVFCAWLSCRLQVINTRFSLRAVTIVWAKTLTITSEKSKSQCLLHTLCPSPNTLKQVIEARVNKVCFNWLSELSWLSWWLRSVSSDDMILFWTSVVTSKLQKPQSGEPQLSCSSPSWEVYQEFSLKLKLCWKGYWISDEVSC